MFPEDDPGLMSLKSVVPTGVPSVTHNSVPLMPSLAEKIQGGLSGVDPSQLAREAAASKFEKDRAFGPAKMTGTQGKLGEEQSSLSAETLTALKALVDLMKTGTVVK